MSVRMACLALSYVSGLYILRAPPYITCLHSLAGDPYPYEGIYTTVPSKEMRTGTEQPVPKPQRSNCILNDMTATASVSLGG